MFHTYPLVLRVAALLQPVIDAVRCHDRDLADQLKRAASSVVLNVAEGHGFRDRNRRRHYGIALGSAREVQAAVDVSLALGYVSELNPELVDKLDHAQAVLVLLTR